MNVDLEEQVLIQYEIHIRFVKVKPWGKYKNPQNNSENMSINNSELQ
jgi:hypothetical protein